jgi:hypothetical protein
MENTLQDSRKIRRSGNLPSPLLGPTLLKYNDFHDLVHAIARELQILEKDSYNVMIKPALYRILVSSCGCLFHLLLGQGDSQSTHLTSCPSFRNSEKKKI